MPVPAGPERIGIAPPPKAPPSIPPKQKGGRGKRTILLIAIIIVLLGGGAAVAALVFPGAAEKTNAPAVNTNQANANTTAANTVANLNVSASNLASNTNVPALNSSFNATTTVNQTTNTTSNANSVSNVNAATNSTTNVNASTNTNTPPASYTQDSDGDKLNNYLEQWLGTSSTNADSDGDGFPDGSEVTSKYSPLGDGQMTATGLETYCARSTVVTQYGLPSTDVSTLCGIASDILANIQVMASNADFYENLDTQLSSSCASFGKIDNKVCSGLVPFIIVDYLVSG